MNSPYDQTEIRLRVIDVKALARLAEIVAITLDHLEGDVGKTLREEGAGAFNISDILWSIAGRNEWDEDGKRDHLADEISAIDAEAERIRNVGRAFAELKQKKREGLKKV